MAGTRSWSYINSVLVVHVRGSRRNPRCTCTCLASGCIVHYSSQQPRSLGLTLASDTTHVRAAGLIHPGRPRPGRSANASSIPSCNPLPMQQFSWWRFVFIFRGTVSSDARISPLGPGLARQLAAGTGNPLKPLCPSTFNRNLFLAKSPIFLMRGLALASSRGWPAAPLSHLASRISRRTRRSDCMWRLAPHDDESLALGCDERIQATWPQRDGGPDGLTCEMSIYCEFSISLSHLHHTNRVFWCFPR